MHRCRALGAALGLAAAGPMLAGTINQDMVVHLTFDNNYNNTVGNAVTAEAVGEPTFGAGKIGSGALVFGFPTDGSFFNYVTLGTPELLNFGGDVSFSVAFWAKLDAFTSDPAFLSNKDWGGGGNVGWVIATAGDGHLQWNFRDGNDRRDYDGPGGLFTDKAWHHIAVTFDRSGNASTYVDGTVAATQALGPSADTLDSGLPTNIGQDGNGYYTDGGSASITDGMMDDVAIWRRVLSAAEVTRLYTSGLAGINAANVPDPQGPTIASFVPSIDGKNVSPTVTVRLTIEDGSTALDKTSVELSFDGVKVTHSLESSDNGKTNTVVYDPPGLLETKSVHTVKVVYKDNATPAVTTTKEYSFTVADYVNIALPAPLYFENFDSTAEGAVPTGWTAKNFSDSTGVGEDLDSSTSDSYMGWVVITGERLMRVFGANRGGVKTGTIVNGQEVTNLVSGSLAYAETDTRGGNQVQYLTSPDYDLTGKSGVHLAFYSTYAQNQDSLGAVEYSIDQGATWLPLRYMINKGDIVLKEDTSVDAEATFTTTAGDIAVYTDPDSGEQVGGFYGAFIGPKQETWKDLAPYIVGKADDDQLDAKEVLLLKMPQADNQAKVRVRFIQAGTGSWYFGIDNFGLYSITAITPAAASKPDDQTAAIGNSATFTTTVSGTEPITIQWLFNGNPIANATSASLTISNVKQADAGDYSVKVTNAGGTATSPAGKLTVFTSVSEVFGQWDFENGDLSATVGAPLEFNGAEVTAGTRFGTTTTLGIPDIGGQVAKVMEVPEITPMGGYVMHGPPANGGGTYVNQYTMIFDLLFPEASAGRWLAFLQTASGNDSDGDFFANVAKGIGISGNYQGTLTANTWHRVALAVDLTGPGASPIVAKFIDGVKVGEQTLGEGKDGRWSLNAQGLTPDASLLFADNDGDNALMYVNSVQVRTGRLSDAQIAELGGATASGIPHGSVEAPAFKSIKKNADGSFTIEWDGGGVLQAAPAVTGPWQDVTGAASPYTFPPSGEMLFGRIKK